MGRQMTLAEVNDEIGAARTNKKEFLEKWIESYRGKILCHSYSRAFTTFCCINSPDEVLDRDTIDHFRNLLIENDL